MWRNTGAGIGLDSRCIGHGILGNGLEGDGKISADVGAGKTRAKDGATFEDDIDHVGGLQRKPGPRHPGLVRGALDPGGVEGLRGDALGGGGVEHDGKIDAPLIPGMHGRHRLGGALVELGALLVVGSLFHVDDGDPFRQLHLLGAPLAPGLAGLVFEHDQILLRNGRHRRPAALAKGEHVVALDAVEEPGAGEGLEGGAHRRLPADDVAGNGVGELGGLDVGEAEPGAAGEVGDDGGKGVALTAAAAEEQPDPAAVAVDKQRVGQGVVDLGAGLADLARPGLVGDQGAGGGIDLNHAWSPHQRPALAFEAALAEERALGVDPDRRRRLPDDAVTRPPLEGVDGAARAAVGDTHLEDHASCRSHRRRARRPRRRSRRRRPRFRRARSSPPSRR